MFAGVFCIQEHFAAVRRQADPSVCRLGASVGNGLDAAINGDVEAHF
jgi:hypothetical protein